MVGNKNHNLVVIIIALVDLIADTYSFYVASIQDNLHSFVEFNMRYTIFRNIILSLEVIIFSYRKKWEIYSRLTRYFVKILLLKILERLQMDAK